MNEMWVSQTYLGKLAPESDVYLYYFFEDYARQSAVPERVLKLLADLGYNFRDSVSAFTPMDDYRGHINRELENKFMDFWGGFNGKTPGIFLSRVPLHKFDPESGEWIYFPITNDIVSDDVKAQKFFRELHRVCKEIIDHRYETEGRLKKQSSVFQALYDSAQLKLTFMGAGIDIKPIISRFVEWRRRH
ncbi:hypothetical protein [Sphingomonas glacialis]|uniref:hypothetical protein n=1 Tax=Sphingomonas glacialis TaxID=658225 RepID=UPI00112D2623|nr:hypothetical protein [Sphingomonas glacialis]